jgi:hypothetical protein
MRSEWREASGEDMAGWLERATARLRELEAENAQLKQELADLRRGLGIAVLIDGQLVPLAPLPPSEQSQQLSTSSQPRVAIPQPNSHLAHTSLIPVPAATPSQGPAPTGRHTFGPLATTPDELPAVRGLLPAAQRPTREWLGSGDAWPEPAAPTRRGRVPRTLGQALTSGPRVRPSVRGSNPAARPAITSEPQQRERGQGQEPRNPYADSFIL